MRALSNSTAAFVAFAIALPVYAQDVLWIPSGTDDYNVASNWDNGTEFPAVPDAAFNERAVINNGGAAVLTATAQAPVGGVVLGQGSSDSGTLRIDSGGILVSQVGTAPAGTPPNGSVLVGAAGRGTLEILSGGSLTATSLSIGGSASSSLIVGGPGQATLDVGGTVTLGRTTRVLPNADISASAIVCQPQANYSLQITNTGNAVPQVTGTVVLDGTLSPEFSGVTPSLGDSYDLFEAGAIAGSFDLIAPSPTPLLESGQKWAVNTVPAAGGRQLAQLKLDEFLVLNVNRGTGELTISNPGSQSKSIDSYSILSESASLLPGSWNSLDKQDAAGGDWGEANPTASRLSELKQSGAHTFATGVTQSLGVANAFNPTEFGTDTEDMAFEYTDNNGSLVNGMVNYIGDPNNLVLTIDPTTGQGQLKNTSPFTVAIDSYTIRSSSGSLSPDTWASLDDQDAAGGDWGEANVSTSRLTELKASGATTLASQAAFNLGDLFAVGGSQDVEFEFLFETETVPRTGIVSYGPISEDVAGDYNGDQIVNIADYTVWRDSLGQTGMNLPADGNGDNAVTQADYAAWKSNFGRTTNMSLSAGNATSVPEPSVLACCIICGWTLVGRRF